MHCETSELEREESPPGSPGAGETSRGLDGSEWVKVPIGCHCCRFTTSEDDDRKLLVGLVRGGLANNHKVFLGCEHKGE